MPIIRGSIFSFALHKLQQLLSTLITKDVYKLRSTFDMVVADLEVRCNLIEESVLKTYNAVINPPPPGKYSFLYYI